MSSHDPEKPDTVDTNPGAGTAEPQGEPTPETPTPAPAAADLTAGELPPGEAAFCRKVFMNANGIRSGWRLGIWLLAAAVSAFVVAALVGIVVKRYVPHFGATNTILSEGSIFAALLMAAAIMGRIENRRVASYGLPGRQAFRGRFWQGAAWGLISLSILLGVIHLDHGFEIQGLALNGASILKFGILWGLAFLAVAFTEESMFRGYPLATLAEGMGFWPAAILLSLGFGAVHLNNGGESWVGALAAGSIGFFFCLTLRRTGTLWFAIGFHCAWDWAESFLYSVPDSGIMVPGHLVRPSYQGPRWLTGGTIGPEGSVFVFVLIALMFVVFALLNREVRFPLPAATRNVDEGVSAL